MPSYSTKILSLGLVSCCLAFTACTSASKAPAAPQLEQLEVATQQAPRKVTRNHFRGDRTGNLSEERLRQLLDAPIELEREARLGIVPVATAYHIDEALPIAQVPHKLSASLEETGFFDITTEVSTDWPADRGVAGLRELGARYRAKYLLLYRHRFVDHTYTNGWGWTYPTIIGAMVTPSRTYRASGVLEATLFDVRTGTLLFTAYERIEGERAMSIWNKDVKRRDFKEHLLQEATDQLIEQVTAKVRRIVVAEDAGRDDAPGGDAHPLTP